MKKLRVLSLFDGISCARVALEKSGFDVEIYYASEIEPNAIKISKNNYQDIIDLGDVRNIDITNISDIDLLIGGSPCQDLSIANKNRTGLEGERSSLFWEYVRVLRGVKPRYFVLENVASMPKDARNIITKELGVEPLMINAALISAQNRKRLFWTNIPNVTLPDDKGILLKDVVETDVDEVYQYRRNYYRRNISGKCPTLMANMGTGGNNVPYVISASVRGRHLVDGKRKDVLGADTKQYLELGHEKAHTLSSVDKDSLVFDHDTLRKLTPVECERLQGLPDNYTDAGVSNSQRYKCLGNAFNVDVVAHILSYLKN